MTPQRAAFYYKRALITPGNFQVSRREEQVISTTSAIRWQQRSSRSATAARRRVVGCLTLMRYAPPGRRERRRLLSRSLQLVMMRLPELLLEMGSKAGLQPNQIAARDQHRIVALVRLC
jgi:hypothetical protein